MDRLKELHIYFDLTKENIPDGELCEAQLCFADTMMYLRAHEGQSDDKISIIHTTDVTRLLGTWNYIDSGRRVFVHYKGTNFEIYDGAKHLGYTFHLGENVFSAVMALMLKEYNF